MHITVKIRDKKNCRFYKNITFCLHSDEKKAAFKSWKKHDDSLPMFCEIDGKNISMLENKNAQS